jgi:hypothetical protein
MVCPNGHGERDGGKFCGICGAILIPDVLHFSTDETVYEIPASASVERKNILLADSRKLLSFMIWPSHTDNTRLKFKVLAICNPDIDISALATSLNAVIAKKLEK